MKLSAAKRKYRNKWIAFQYSDRDKSIGKVLAYDRNKDKFHLKVMALKKPYKNLYVTYTGPLVPKGTVVVLCSN